MSRPSEHLTSEIAQELQHASGEQRRRIRRIEIVEVILLALVAVATAWSGYQAARWDGREALLYQTSSRLRNEADAANTTGGQQRLLDTSTFNTWILVRELGEKRVADLYVRRFSPEYMVAFHAWLETDPFSNPDAPAGPIFMPEYDNAQLERAHALNEQAEVAFENATHSREISDDYVRLTVLFATVLFLIAVAQRFTTHGVRIATTAIACVLMLVAVVGIAGLPRL